MRRSAWLSWVVLVSLCLSSSAALAQLRNAELGFRPPSDSRVVGFHVYLASSAGGYASYRDDINYLPPADSTGVARYALTGLEQFSDVFVTLRSYDASGAESAFSNEIKLAAIQQCLVTGCNDSNPCTQDTCGTAGCVFDPTPRTGTACDDGNPATHADQCSAGVCAGVACDADSQCSDGNACNGNETCVGSACVSGAALVCPTEDGPCFDSYCDTALGCRVQLHPDGEACTTANTGSAGRCSAGVCAATITTSLCPKSASWWCERWYRKRR